MTRCSQQANFLNFKKCLWRTESRCKLYPRLLLHCFLHRWLLLLLLQLQYFPKSWCFQLLSVTNIYPTMPPQKTKAQEHQSALDWYNEEMRKQRAAEAELDGIKSCYCKDPKWLLAFVVAILIFALHLMFPAAQSPTAARVPIRAASICFEDFPARDLERGSTSGCLPVAAPERPKEKDRSEFLPCPPNAQCVGGAIASCNGIYLVKRETTCVLSYSALRLIGEAVNLLKQMTTEVLCSGSQVKHESLVQQDPQDDRALFSTNDIVQRLRIRPELLLLAPDGTFVFSDDNEMIGLHTQIGLDISWSCHCKNIIAPVWNVVVSQIGSWTSWIWNEVAAVLQIELGVSSIWDGAWKVPVFVVFKVWQCTHELGNLLAWVWVYVIGAALLLYFLHQAHQHKRDAEERSAEMREAVELVQVKYRALQELSQSPEGLLVSVLRERVGCAKCPDSFWEKVEESIEASEVKMKVGTGRDGYAEIVYHL